jgi:hypothetical protein
LGNVHLAARNDVTRRFLMLHKELPAFGAARNRARPAPKTHLREAVFGRRCHGLLPFMFLRLPGRAAKMVSLVASGV